MKKVYDLTENPQGIIQFVEKFLALSELKVYGTGETIVDQRSPMTAFYLILEGYAETYKEGSNGEVKNYGLMGPYTLIGMSSLDDYQHHTTYRAKTQMLAAMMPRERIREWSREMLMTVIDIQTGKSRNAYRQLLCEHTESAASRIAQLLLEIGAPGRDPEIGGIPCLCIFSAPEIARQINASPARVGQVLAEMTKTRAVIFSGKNILFVPERLESYLEE